jgi:hypothetical protein
MSAIPRKRVLPRWIKTVIWTAGLASAYAVTGFFIAPAIIKSLMIKRLPGLTKRQAAIRDVTFNPFTFALAVRGLSLTETNGETFAGFDEFHLQFQAVSSLSHRAWVFQDVTITHPFAHIIRHKDGSFNIDNLADTNAAPAAKAAPAAALPPVLVENLGLAGASLEADDLTMAGPFHDKLAPINLQLTDFAITFNAASAFVFSALTDANEKITASGKITVQPLQAFGSIRVTGLDLSRYEPYLAAFTRGKLADGKIDAGADYQIGIRPTGFDATVTNGTVQLTNLRVKSPDTGETVLSVPMLAVRLTEANLRKQTVHVASIKSSGGSLLVRQDHDGTINLLNLLAKATPVAGPVSPQPAAAASWTAQVDEIAFDGYGVTVEDQKPERPVKMDVSALAFTIKGFNSASNSPVAMAVTMRLNGQASLSLNGTLATVPLSGDLSFELAGLDLSPFTPYLPSQIKIALSKGQLQLRGRVKGGVATIGPEGSFAGDISLKNIATVDPVHDRDLIKFDELAVKGIKASYPPVKLQIEEFALTGFNANVVIDTNRQINLLAMLSTNAPTTAPAFSTAPAITMDLGALVIEKASFHCVDESIEPHAMFDLAELSGTIKGLSSQPQATAKLDLRGNVDQFSPYSISGTIDPLAKNISLNLAVAFQNIDLTPLGPYMEKYGGYPLNKGKLALQLNCKVALRNLTATNSVVIADLSLGAKKDSPEATHLPIKLGVALMKDRQGKISLDVPVSGNLDDPNFKIGPAIWHVVENLLAKAAASPFTLLGKALGGGGEELSAVDFQPGEALLAPSEQAKLRKLAKALYERPALTLRIAGACAPSADSAVVARRHLQRRINKLRAEEQAAVGRPVQNVESIQLEPADYARLLQRLYKQTYGPGQAASLPARTPLITDNLPPGKAPKLVYLPSWPEASSQSTSGFMKGGERLIQHEHVERFAPMASAPKPVAPAQPTTAAKPELAQMEQRLIADIHVTDDELRELEQLRAHAVQSALLESGQISPEHVIILAPKAINAAAQGEMRANFSLE